MNLRTSSPDRAVPSPLPLWHSYQHTLLYLSPINRLLIRVLFPLLVCVCVGGDGEGATEIGGERGNRWSVRKETMRLRYVEVEWESGLSRWKCCTKISQCFSPLYNYSVLVLSNVMLWTVACDSLMWLFQLQYQYIIFTTSILLLEPAWSVVQTADNHTKWSCC